MLLSFKPGILWRCAVLLAIALSFCVLVIVNQGPSIPHTEGQLPQQAYIWQRAWTKDTCDAASQYGGSFERLVVLNSEVSWVDGNPRVAQIPLNIPVLASSRSVGLALRIGPSNNRIMREGRTSDFLVELAVTDIFESRQKRLKPAELQVDFDCPVSQLNDYAKWITVLSDRLAPVPVTITVLPCWQDHSAFEAIARVAPNFVLQVHSLERPANVSTMKPLCDFEKARVWITNAARFGVPFRVALPTCGYRVAFDRSSGHFVGLIAEGPNRMWPQTIESRELAPETDGMACLIRDLSLSRPKALTGVIWYRLPVVFCFS